MNCNSATPDIYPKLPQWIESGFKDGKGIPPGPWWTEEIRGVTWDGKGNMLTTRKTACLCMPCGHFCSIGSHTISPEGVVSPSILCRNGPGGTCDKGYHDYGKLEGWVP